jgi:hypothetical protein
MDFGTRIATVASLLGFHRRVVEQVCEDTPQIVSSHLWGVYITQQGRQMSQYASLSSLYVSPARNIPTLRVQKALRGCQSGFGNPMFSCDQTTVASERNNTVWFSGIPDCYLLPRVRGSWSSPNMRLS